jgi:hypothetical protein
VDRPSWAPAHHRPRDSPGAEAERRFATTKPSHKPVHMEGGMIVLAKIG